MDITYLEENNKFWIVTKYIVDKDLLKLTEKEIIDILKIN